MGRAKEAYIELMNNAPPCAIEECIVDELPCEGCTKKGVNQS